MRHAVSFFVVVLILAVAAGDHAIAARVGQRTGSIAGEVRVCNIPDHCLTRTFQITAIDRGGRRVARTTTNDAANSYRLLVPAGNYSLIATSNGLRCTRGATAVAGRTVTANIICLVP